MQQSFAAKVGQIPSEATMPGSFRDDDDGNDDTVGVPLGGGYTKISVIIVTTVIFADKTTGRPGA